ncbi:MAG: 30S ribosomal protein S17 [bacterium]|nr:30S ribosomal protein S17 [bacterium]
MKGKIVEKKGIVVSDKMDKTRIVMVETMTQHPIYKKIIRKRKKFVAHDEDNISKKGDIVRIIQTRPLSKTKRWKIIEIIGKKGDFGGTIEVNASGS